MIHDTASVQTQNIGTGTTIWQFAVILKEAKIGANCNINCHTFIENDVILGNNVTVKSGVFLWDGIVAEDNVFIGPNATFTNDKYPRSKQYPGSFQKTILKKGCSIGANATILGGIQIGEFAIIGAGSVVTKNIPANALVTGSPARIVGWVNNSGEKLVFGDGEELTDTSGNRYVVEKNILIKI